VPRISDEFLECVVYIYHDEPRAYAGEAAGGTGFLVGVPVEGFLNAASVFVVTNRHNIERGGRAVRLNTIGGDIDVKEINASNWIMHPEGADISIAGIGLDDHHQFRFLHLDHLLSKNILEVYNIGPGDDVFVVGRFILHDGKQRNQPTVRFGAIAQMPGEKIQLPDGSEQESFLVEARSISGYSGSPVFTQIPRWSSGYRRFNTNWGYGPWLLGIDYYHPSVVEHVRKSPNGDYVNPDWYVESNTGMMAVVPAWKLAEMFEMPEIKATLASDRAEVAALQKQQ
jgi:hypothetical protein